MKRNKILLYLITVLCLSIYSALYADDMQKVIILPFKNIDKNPNYEYLEASITDSIRENLKTKFVFAETAERDWKLISKKNFLYDNECYTATYGMTLGLFANQDVIINGGFTIKQGGKDQDAVSTTVRIISITEKKIISEFVIDIPANSELFKAIGEVADKAAKEASKALPNKDDWEKTRGKKKVEKKIFSNVALGIRGGGAFYLGGWADQFSTKLPAFGFSLRANMPMIADRLFVSALYNNFQHEFSKSAKNYLANVGLALLTANHLVGGNVGYDFFIKDIFLLSPKLGGGAIFQTSQISGVVSQTVNNNIPWVGIGLDFTWLATDSLRLVLDVTFNAEFEKSTNTGTITTTFFPMAMLGMNINF
ncbi:MAG: hypothetical protein OEV78_02615 [Spirochaetia bacterium]|nr:hypothetical protein [Spirochaetia bacterium]